MGPGEIRNFFQITLPNIYPFLLIAILLRFMDNFRFIDHILVLTGGGPADSTKILPTYLFDVSFQFFKLGRGAAIALTLLAVTIILGLILVRVFQITNRANQAGRQLMASSDIVQYRSPLRTAVNVAVAVFLGVYVVWTLLPLVVMFVSSFKDLLEAFNLPTRRRLGRHHAVLRLHADLQALHRPLRRRQLRHLHVQLDRRVGRLGGHLGGPRLDVRLLALAGINFRGKQDLFFWIISTRMAPVVAVMVPLYAIFRGLGLVGTLPGLILAYTTFNLPFAIWMLKGFFDNVPYAIEEAQMCDGATRFQAFLSILPLVAPGIGAFLVLCILFAWNDFLFASIIGSGGAKTLPVATKELVQPQNIQWGKIMAAGVVTTLPMMFLGLLIRRYLVAGLTMGAVKE